MIKDLRNLIFLYIDIDEYYLLRKAYKLSVKFYCRNVNTFANTQSYINFRAKHVLHKSLLDWASRAGYFGVVKYLHKNGTTGTKWTMGWASERGYLNIVKYLNKFKIPDLEDAMEWACIGGQLQTVKYLYKAGAPVSDAAMRYTVINKCSDIVEYLQKNEK